MAPWKLPLVVAALVVPIVAGFLTAGPALGVAAGALAVLALLVVAARQKPRGPIGSAPSAEGVRRVLIVAAAAVEDPGDVARVVRELDLEGSGGDEEVRVLVPARIGFLARWASDVEPARQSAQRQLVGTVAALAKAGVAAEARVGDEDVVQAVEDQLQSYFATEVLLVDEGGDGEEEEAAAELRARLVADFHRLRLAK
jgi:hypothetical protein